MSASQSLPRKLLPALPLLWSFAFLSYMLRMNISVAQQYMSPALGLTDIQMGQVFSAFMLGYALFQIPAGVFGDRSGPRVVLCLAAISWGVLTFLTGLLPGKLLAGSMASLTALIVLRFLLGAGEAATYPVASLAIARWIPVSRHAFSNAIVIAGSTVGAAFTPPLVANLMSAFGWRPVFYVMTVLPLILAGVWWVGRRESPRTTTPSGESTDQLAAPKSWLFLLRERDVAVVAGSYFLDSYVLFIYVFWLYKYLVDVRKFGVLSGGWATGLPFAVATLAVPVIGYASDRISAKYGVRRGRRATIMSCLAASALLLFVGASASSPSIALAAIALSVGFLFSTEGSFWATSIELGGRHAGASGGLMNMAGNLGGVVSTSAMPVLIHYFGWFTALASGSVLAFLGAGIWMFISTDSPLKQPRA